MVSPLITRLWPFVNFMYDTNRLPDNENVCPPKLPQTPLYPDLKTNTPHPTSK